MLHLIKKDLMIHNVSWLIYFGMLLFFTIFDKDPMFIIAFMSAIVIMYAFYFDEQTNGHKLWNALPFTRHEIVSARYSSLLIITLIMMLAVIISSLLFNKEWNSVFWQEVFGSFITIIITSAICFPVFYYFAQRSVMFILFVLYIVFVFAAVHGIYYLGIYMFNLASVSFEWLYGVGILGVLLLYLLSWRLSVRIYQAKEIL